MSAPAGASRLRVVQVRDDAARRRSTRGHRPRSGQPWATPADAPVTIGATCVGCGCCLATCPRAALRPAPRRPRLDPGRCTGCLECLEVCPVGAIEETVPELPRPPTQLGSTT